MGMKDRWKRKGTTGSKDQGGKKRGAWNKGVCVPSHALWKCVMAMATVYTCPLK